MKVFIKTYGCTLNNSDSDRMRAKLEKEGHSIVEREEEADVVILNSCAVKDATEKKQLYRIQNYGKEGKALVVAGCLTYNKKLIRNVNKRVVLVSTGSVEEINKAVEDAKEGRVSEYLKFNRKRKSRVYVIQGIARIALQEGCTESCTYCATKLARPLMFSYPPRDIFESIEEAIDKGAIEIQLTGMDTGAYGLDFKSDLAELLTAIGEKTEKKEKEFRIRVGMLNPVHTKRMKSRIVESLRFSKFYKFFHLPVQSGSKRILELMHRKADDDEFRRITKEIREKYKEVSIATDIIVGFPTEEDNDFEETVKLIEEVKPDVVNISKFSPRPGTKAYSMQWVNSEKIKKRSKELSEIVKEISEKNNEKYLGKEVEVLITEKGREGQSKGRTNSYKQVVLNKEIEIGRWVKVRVEEVSHTGLKGDVVELLS